MRLARREVGTARWRKPFGAHFDDFRLAPGDDAVVVAESLGTLAPLQMVPVD